MRNFDHVIILCLFLFLLIQTGRKGGLAEEAMKIANGILSRSSNSPFPKPGKGGKDDAKAKDVKKGVSSFDLSSLLPLDSAWN